jgi:hypothetical protein
MKYLSELVDELKELMSGIVKNAALWASQNITGAIVQQSIDAVNAMETEVAELKKQLSEKLTAARALQDATSQFVTKLENFAYAIHTDTPEKLVEYGLQPHKEAKSKSVPTQKPSVTLEDDTDGQGFIVSTNTDSDATLYEWYRGIAADASKTDVIPAMTLFKTTQKISFVDDDVIKGQRVFYKVRAVNPAGVGPWSDVASRVQ